LLGWLLGIFSAIISSVIISKINERKTKQNLACILGIEINLNLYSIKKILNKEVGWKFKTEVFNNFFEYLPLLGKDLSVAVIYFYYSVERKLKEFDEFESEELKEMLKIWRSDRFSAMIEEWVDLQKHGNAVLDELYLICGIHFQKKTKELSNTSEAQ
jgi:hypothetical protein